VGIWGGEDQFGTGLCGVVDDSV